MQHKPDPVQRILCIFYSQSNRFYGNYTASLDAKRMHSFQSKPYFLFTCVKLFIHLAALLMTNLVQPAAFEQPSAVIATSALPIQESISNAESSFKAGGKIARGTLMNIKKEVLHSAQLLHVLKSAIGEMGATMIENSEVTSTDDLNCISVGVILSESSAFIHLFRNTRIAIAVIFTCGNVVDPQDGIAILGRDLEAEQTLVTFHEVGEKGVEPQHYILQ